ncbi:zinc carboxypeptidase A 1-like [Episyrphus balteatus]|uniref:zinc carboxypeptidase A 1-like n=1 Tax=Episyrphus balteatus TaxID=286459 RepID=UPI002485E341|nr:zinc carboxypeptidase A 1-like [Episyrphus balteatus]
MSQTLWVVVLGLCLALAFGERTRYDNYRVYNVNPSNLEQLKILQELEGTSDSLIFLQGPYSVAKDIQVVVAPHKFNDFVEGLQRNNINVQLIEKNFQKILDNDEPNQVSSRSGVYDWTAYHTLEETYSWLESLAKAYPEKVELIVGGKSYENRQILGVKISHKPGNKGIFIEGGIHAREWISPATVTYLINELLTNNRTKDMAENYDWYIFPHVNPDGYAYTWTGDRMWRKTRKPYGSCAGADPNRNWDLSWNTVGASSSACSETYAGPSAASEIEIQSLSSYLESLKGKIDLYLSFHAYSQYLLYPFGYTSKLPENAKDYEAVYDATVAAIKKRHGTKYTGGNIYDAIYPASGSSIDWVYSKIGCKLTFSYELRPSSSSLLTGFNLPASKIIPTGDETIDSVVAMVNKAKELKYL